MFFKGFLKSLSSAINSAPDIDWNILQDRGKMSVFNRKSENLYMLSKFIH